MEFQELLQALISNNSFEPQNNPLEWGLLLILSTFNREGTEVELWS